MVYFPVSGGQTWEQTDGALYSALKDLWFVEGQAFLPYRDVFVCDFNSKVLTWQHVVLYSDGDMDHFFPGSSKWPWPNDKQQLGLWIKPQYGACESLITLFLMHNTLILTCFFFFSVFISTPQPSWFSSTILFISIKIHIYWLPKTMTYLTLNISLPHTPFT